MELISYFGNDRKKLQKNKSAVLSPDLLSKNNMDAMA
jgi:hypothetical protein